MRKFALPVAIGISLACAVAQAQTLDSQHIGNGAITTVTGPAPAEPGEWKLGFSGFFRAPMRIGMAKRENAGPGQNTWNFHQPRVPDDQYLSWLYTRNNERDWAEAFLSYGNGVVTGTVGFQAYNFTDATWNDQDAQLGISQGWVTWKPDIGLQGARLTWKVGSFWNRYGAAGKYDAGKYDTYIFGRTHAMGETLRGEYDIADWTLSLEHGIGAKPGHPSVAPPSGFTFLHHAHAGAEYKKRIRLGAHYLASFARDALATPAAPDGSLNVGGGEVRIDGGLLGELYVGYSRVQAKSARSVAPAIETVHSLGGGYFGLGFVENYLGPASLGTGSLDTVEVQYDFSFGYLYRNLRVWGTEFWGDGPDCTLSLFGMHNWVHSDDPAFDGVRKLKFGGEVIYTPLSWLSAGIRGDRVMPNHRDSTQSFSVLAPKILLRSQFVTHELFTIQYSRYFYGDNPPAPSGPIQPYGYGSPMITGRPDEHVFKVQATMWW